MEDVATLSDSELRRELLLHGVNVGPVTPTTRSVYQKKLMKVLSGEVSKDSNEDDDDDNDDEHIEHDSTPFTSIQQNNLDHEDYKIKSSYEETSYHVSTPKHDLQHKCPTNLIIQESPYSRYYEPVDDVLRRRPLYTPSGSSVKRSVFTSQPTSTPTKSYQPVQISNSKIHKTSNSSLYCKIGAVIFLVLAILVLLVYFYMEPMVWREISTFKKYAK
ncbi:uncharacterized protein LOC100197248 isoform X1 [Hydra vulgaris]|uniref:uncharacterized protein LOC100197248 isoform X1 n=1 Tax=Hydra vulgaris TaxID=6087 RepID=UPI0032EA3D0C